MTVRRDHHRFPGTVLKCMLPRVPETIRCVGRTHTFSYHSLTLLFPSNWKASNRRGSKAASGMVGEMHFLGPVSDLMNLSLRVTPLLPKHLHVMSWQPDISFPTTRVISHMKSFMIRNCLLKGIDNPFGGGVFPSSLRILSI